jgi:bis(5'-nucleosyl)-tetraphosphatase (symmetrical)
MAVYAIGDLQGCLDELQELLELIHYQPDNDLLWFTGDLVNRGPKSLESLRYVRELGDSAVTVLGNHDLHLLAAAFDPVHARSNDTLDHILTAPDRDELLHWLRRRPLLHHDEELGFTMVHAGLLPSWDLAQARTNARELETVLRSDNYMDFFEHMYGNKPRRWSDDLQGWDRLRVIVNCFTRLRYCDENGCMALKAKGQPGSQPEGFKPWFEHPRRKSRDLRILFGHWSTLGPCTEPGVFPLDTGCVWGGKFTALRLDGDLERYELQCPEARKPKKGK